MNHPAGTGATGPRLSRRDRRRRVLATLVMTAVVAAMLAGPFASTSRAQGTLPERIDASVARALQMMAREQRPTGAWVMQSNIESTGITSLVIMAFMAGGHVPGEGPYGDQLEQAIRWVIAQQKPNGLLVNRSGRGPMYSHGIATLMLAEVYGMCNKKLQREVRFALERGIRLILAAQQVNKPASHDGGWRYNITSSDSDLSVTGWQLLALRAAKNVGCDVPAESIERAIGYVKKCAVRNNDGFGYQAGHNATPTRTGTGILALEVCGEHRCVEVMGGANYLIRKPLREHDAFFYYGAYYCTVGLFKVGGEYWDRSSLHIYEMLLRLQNFDGSWPLGRSGEMSAGRYYSTSMAVLALAVEYRYLPIYQR